ncbi:MAG: hypothetical protein K2P52_08425 [Campylobacterales bacterium]|nr:hypothetical protein [Campylobacterales bacterium]
MSNINRFKQDNIYFNVEFLGSDTIPNQQMVYDTTLNESIVDNSIQYYATIVDFAIPLSSVPIMIMPIKPNSGFTNQSLLNITFLHNNVVISTQIVIFVPERNDIIQPNQNNPNQMVITPYYYLYSYTALIDMLNTTLKACYTDLQAAFPAIAQSVANQTPYFIYNPSSELISLITPYSFNTTIAQPDVVTIQINNDLLTYLNGFSFKYINRTVGPTSLSFSQFNISTYNQNNYPTNTYPAIPTYIETVQSYDNMAAWSDLKKVIIVSNSLPIAGESIQRGSNINNIVNTQYVLSSFTPEVIKGGDQRSVIYYNPASQYRLLDIISDLDIKRIDITIYWEDFKNNWYIMDIQPNDNATVRLAFVKKDLYKSNLLKKM